MDKLVYKPFVEISVICICFVKLQEFVDKYGYDYVSILLFANALTGDFEGVSLPDCIFQFRNSEPFVNLSLEQERFIYQLFLSTLKVKGV